MDGSKPGNRSVLFYGTGGPTDGQGNGGTAWAVGLASSLTFPSCSASQAVIVGSRVVFHDWFNPFCAFKTNACQQQGVGNCSYSPDAAGCTRGTLAADPQGVLGGWLQRYNYAGTNDPKSNASFTCAGNSNVFGLPSLWTPNVFDGDYCHANVTIVAVPQPEPQPEPTPTETEIEA